MKLLIRGSISSCPLFGKQITYLVFFGQSNKWQSQKAAYSIYAFRLASMAGMPFFANDIVGMAVPWL